jgi:hypothetical protein
VDGVQPKWSARRNKLPQPFAKGFFACKESG